MFNELPIGPGTVLRDILGTEIKQGPTFIDYIAQS